MIKFINLIILIIFLCILDWFIEKSPERSNVLSDVSDVKSILCRLNWCLSTDHQHHPVTSCDPSELPGISHHRHQQPPQSFDATKCNLTWHSINCNRVLPCDATSHLPCDVISLTVIFLVTRYNAVLHPFECSANFCNAACGVVSCPTRWSLYWPLALYIDHLSILSTERRGNVLPVVQIYKPVDGMHKGSIQEWDRWCNTLYKKIPRRRQSSQIQLNAMHCNAIEVNWMQMQSNAIKCNAMEGNAVQESPRRRRQSSVNPPTGNTPPERPSLTSRFNSFTRSRADAGQKWCLINLKSAITCEPLTNLTTMCDVPLIWHIIVNWLTYYSQLIC